MGSENAAVNCALGKILLFVYWECCCYLLSRNDTVIWIVGIMLFG